MMKTAALHGLVLIFAFSMEGAVWSESPCSQESKEVAWRQLQSKAAKSPEALARDVEVFRSQCGLPLSFWAGPRAAQSEKRDHPCGEVVLAFVRTIPSPSDPLTESEEVFELGPAGDIVQRWWVPVDSIVAGVAGKELMILEEVGEEDVSRVYLAVRPGGPFRVVPVTESSQLTSVPCPTFEGLSDSSYMGCWRTVDTVSGVERRIAYEGPCT